MMAVAAVAAAEVVVVVSVVMVRNRTCHPLGSVSQRSMN
jgi:hypothetical protein